MLDVAAGGAGVCNKGVTGDCAVASFMATTIPVLDERVFLGLLKPDGGPAMVSTGFGGDTACETAGRMPPWTAGLGRRVLCQS